MGANHNCVNWAVYDDLGRWLTLHCCLLACLACLPCLPACLAYLLPALPTCLRASS